MSVCTSIREDPLFLVSNPQLFLEKSKQNYRRMGMRGRVHVPYISRALVSIILVHGMGWYNFTLFRSLFFYTKMTGVILMTREYRMAREYRMTRE